jgi:hypothetical protein
MSTETLELREGLATVVDLQHSGASRFASRPGRVLAALLSRERLKKVGPNRFRYRSRPVAVGPWKLQPELQFCAEWDGTAVLIRLEDCQLHGFPTGANQPPIRFEMDASIRPTESQLMAEAITRLAIPPTSAARLLPHSLLRFLGQQALQACLARLERRCQTRLPLVAQAWMQRGGDRHHGAEELP